MVSLTDSTLKKFYHGPRRLYPGFENVIKLRYIRSLKNFFQLYVPLADEWTLFDNSSATQALPVAAHYANQLTVTEPTTWHKLQKLSKTA